MISSLDGKNDLSLHVYHKLCYCTICKKDCKSLFKYGMHVVKKHSTQSFTIHTLKIFIQKEIIKQLQKIDNYDKLEQEAQILLFAKVKAQLKKETPLLLKGFIPDGRNSRKSRKSRSKRKSRKSRRSGRCPDRILNPDHPFAKMPCRLHYFFITEDGIIGHEYKIGYKFDANYNYKPEDSYENTKKIIKWLIKNNYTSNANEIKNYHNRLLDLNMFPHSVKYLIK